MLGAPVLLHAVPRPDTPQPCTLAFTSVPRPVHIAPVRAAPGPCPDTH